MSVAPVELGIEAVPSPLGEVLLVWKGEALVALDWADCRARLDDLLTRRFGAYQTAPRQGSSAADAVRAYFDGATDALEGLEVDPGGTEFQAAVWSALRRIPVGETTTYAAIAAALDRPGAERAVGAANGSNPISLVVPCHRVIGADGALRGYAGGLERKRWLLVHEGAPVPAEQASLFV